MYGKNKFHMSYSAYALWKRNKDAYRRHYYEGEKPFETAETRFGNTIHELLEKQDERVSHIPHYTLFEHPIEVTIGGNKVIGRLDAFDEDRIRFLDYKTGHSPWTSLKVRKLEQLPFYSMLLKEKFGRVDRICHLVWIETEFMEKSTEFDGNILYAQTRELKLTGKVKKFRRFIRKWERERIKLDLLQVCEEIKKDYEHYKQIHVEDCKVRAQEIAPTA